MRISDWSSDVCSSDLPRPCGSDQGDRRDHGSYRSLTGCSATCDRVAGPEVKATRTTTAPTRAPPGNAIHGTRLPASRFASITVTSSAPCAAAYIDSGPSAEPTATISQPAGKIGRAHVSTTVTNAHLLCRLL